MLTARDRPPEEAAEDTSFARGLRVFLTVADRGEIRADELAVVLETPLSTIYRYLRTLTEFGFLERSESGYRLGPRIHMTGGATVTTEELVRAADPVLRMLADETGETAIIARRIATTAVCLHEIPSRHALRATCEPGTTQQLHEGAVARVLLAFAPAGVQDEVFEGRHGARSLRRELARVVRDGLARSESEPDSGIVAIAVPVLRDDGIVGAIGLLAPTDRVDLAWRARAARLLPEAATAVAAALGPS
jgi:DNA-binding IclR family transcriptional regulator